MIYIGVSDFVCREIDGIWQGMPLSSQAKNYLICIPPSGVQMNPAKHREQTGSSSSLASRELLAMPIGLPTKTSLHQINTPYPALQRVVSYLSQR
jgi:hypothetical protein